MSEKFDRAPIQTDEADINTPPAQDSPENIVNILNDDCLQLVLLKLKNVADFWSAAQVCTRFQANAKACFPFEKLLFRYDKSHDPGAKTYTPLIRKIIRRNTLICVPFESAEDFLRLFGPRIKSIHCHLYSVSGDIGQMDHEENLRLISQYCGQTLDELEIGHSWCTSSINLRSPYQALKKLKLEQIVFSNSNPSLMLPTLEKLEIRYVNTQMDWLANRFPMLQHLKMCKNNFTNDKFIEFQNRNPQLQSLHMSWCNFTFAWENIADRLPNIVELSLDNLVVRRIGNLSALRQLRKLQFLGYMGDILSERMSLFSALVRNNTPIEELKIYGVDAELGVILQKLKTIKVLHIPRTPVQIVLDLVKHLPELEELLIEGNIITLMTVRKIVQNCKKNNENMRKIDIDYGLKLDGTTDLTELNTIIALTTNRVELNLHLWGYFHSNEVTFEYEEMMKNHIRDQNNKYKLTSARK